MFFIYHSRANDPLAAVQRIHNRAAAHARQAAKAVAIIDVDVDTAGPDLMNCYSHAGTIECVTAVDKGCKERAKNPPPARINAMIERV